MSITRGHGNGTDCQQSSQNGAPLGGQHFAQFCQAEHRLITHTHFDVTSRAYVCTDVAANALAVVSIHITTCRGFATLDLEYCSLRAVNHAVVALEAQTAAHATLGFSHHLLVVQLHQALFEVTQCLLSIQRNVFTHVACHVGEVPKEQLVGWNHILARTVFKVMNCELCTVTTSHTQVNILGECFRLDHLFFG